MRITAPAIGGLAIATAVALVWLFQPEPEPPSRVVGEDAAAPASAERASLPAAQESPIPGAPATPPRAVEERVGESAVSPSPTSEAAPLPGQPPPTPMAQLLAEREKEFPPEVAAGEREFAA